MFNPLELLEWFASWVERVHSVVKPPIVRVLSYDTVLYRFVPFIALLALLSYPIAYLFVWVNEDDKQIDIEETEETTGEAREEIQQKGDIKKDE